MPLAMVRTPGYLVIRVKAPTWISIFLKPLLLLWAGTTEGPSSSLRVPVFSQGLLGFKTLASETLGPFWASSAWPRRRKAVRDGMSSCSSTERAGLTPELI